MKKFIEVTINGKPTIINTRLIESVDVDRNGKAVIYFTSKINPFLQNRITVEESYEYFKIALLS